jgi:histidyl-tRNA synthetase
MFMSGRLALWLGLVEGVPRRAARRANRALSPAEENAKAAPMVTKVQAVRGTQDMLGEQAERFHTVVAAFDRVRRLYGFSRVEVPVFEATEVFARSIGETTDIVSKEMYTFPDRGGDSLTLRPEFTAGICRAYLSEGWQQHAPLKLATEGPVFRYERPQKGRFRQFHQLDAEIIGTDAPAADVELLALADQLLRELGIADGVTLQLNTLGDAATREAWRAALVEHFGAHRDELSEDSLMRLDKNPLRILDSKDPRDRPIADAAPSIDDFLTAEAAEFFSKVTAGLDAAGVAWTRNARLVRGLDYYRHTAFEFVTERLGAQGTVLAGGRYDGLIEALGGPHTPAVGWAAGIERLAMLIDPPVRKEPLFAVIADSPSQEMEARQITRQLRQNGVNVSRAYSGNAKRQAELARKAGVDALVYVRAAEAQGERINVSVARDTPFDHSDLDLRVMGALADSSLSGDIDA